MTEDVSSYDYKSKKAEAKAAKAAAKALRPWFKKKRYVIPLGFLVLIAVSQATGGGQDTNTVTPGDTPSATATNPTQEEEQEFDGAVGAKVADGQFSFVVSGIECGLKEVGNEFLSQKAQGEYCVLAVKVTNIGDEPQYLFADNQYLYDQKGRKFSADTTASIYSGQDGDVWMSEINPGNSIKGYIFFDVPKGTKLSHVELHDSAFSLGVTVKL